MTSSALSIPLRVIVSGSVPASSATCARADRAPDHAAAEAAPRRPLQHFPA